MGVLGGADGQTKVVIFVDRAQRTRRPRYNGSLDAHSAPVRDAHHIVAHDKKCGAERGRRCDCQPDIIDRETGEVLNRRGLAMEE